MEFIKTKCRKCGYEIVIPEHTETVVCGSCGNVNHFGRISSILKKYSEAGDISRPEEFTTEIKKPSYKTIPGQIPGIPEKASPSEEEEIDFPEEKTASKIMTIIFIMAPFIAMAVEFFKLPSYAALLIIILVVVIVFTLRKK